MTHEHQSRREFLGNFALAGAALSIAGAPGFLDRSGWFAPPASPAVDLLHDTYNGMLAFVVPGSDRYSVAQGVSAASPGGVEAGIADVLIATIDGSTPYVPGFASLVATLLDNLALAVNPGAGGEFISPFARLSWSGKAAVFQIMDATPQFQLLSSVLPGFVAFFVYSEAGTFDPTTRTLTARPLGWDLSHYTGVSDGRDEFLGYLRRD